MSDGTSTMTAGCGWLTSIWATDRKKNVRFRPSYHRPNPTGPPSDPAKSLKRSGGFETPFALLNQSFASVLSLRKYSKSDAEYLFEPERLTKSICPPGRWPNSGAYVDV